MEFRTLSTTSNLVVVLAAVNRLSKQNPSDKPFLWHRPSNASRVESMIRYITTLAPSIFQEPVSQTVKDQLVVRRFEDDLWKAFGLKGVFVPDELLKECQQRLRQANRNGASPSITDVGDLKVILQILDTIHRERKGYSVDNQVSIRAQPTFLKPIPPKKFRKKFKSDFGGHFWVLIIGNDMYSKGPLGGCINDAILVQDYLTDYLGVPVDHIRFLRNATRKDMVDGFYDLRDNHKIQYGDNILIHFSGHGTSYDTDEYFMNFITTAGSIEGICPVDRGPSVPDISDREINAILHELTTEKGENITLFLDCCHSGGAVRSYSSGPDTGAIRYTSPLCTNENEDEQMPDLSIMFQAADTNPRRRSDTPLTSSDFWMGNINGFVQLASCQDFQVAKEVIFSLVPNSKRKSSKRPHNPVCKESKELEHSQDDSSRGPIFSTVKGAPGWKPKSSNGGSSGTSSSEPSQKQYGSFTWTLVNVLKSKVGRTGTYEDVIASVGQLSDMQQPLVVGRRKHSRLWFRDTNSSIVKPSAPSKIRPHKQVLTVE